MNYTDYNNIIDDIYQGSMPPKGDKIYKLGFGIVVLMADSYQPSSKDFIGVSVIHCPIDDDYSRYPSRDGKNKIKKAIDQVNMVKKINPSAKILTTCMAGKNRSALFNALLIKQKYNFTNQQIIDLIRSKRSGTLENPRFVDYINSL